MTVVCALAACGRLGFDFHYTPPGCALFLEMDSESFADSCGNNTVQRIGGPTAEADGVRGQAATFDGVDDCLHVADAPILRASTELTMAAWVYPTSFASGVAKGILNKRSDIDVEHAYAMFIWTGDHVFVDVQGIDNRMSTPSQIVTGRWQQLTVVYNGNRPSAERIDVYIDGQRDAVLAENAASIMPYASPMFVGCQPGSFGDGEYYTGLLDDVGVWTRAWSEEEVVDWYAATQP